MGAAAMAATVACLFTTLQPARASFGDLIEENNQKLREARAAGDKGSIEFYEARGQQIVDDENRASRARQARFEERLQEQREYRERMRAERERRQWLHQQQEVR